MKNSNDYISKTIGEIVTGDFRASEIFKKAGIDFCCGGGMDFNSACKKVSIDPEVLLKQLSALENQPIQQAQNYHEWPPETLMDHIVNTHHKYVLKTMPELLFYTLKISSVHGRNHPELEDVAELFGNINYELKQHLQKEEEVLFPAILKRLNTGSAEAKSIIQSEIARMTGEHEFAGGAMDKICSITSNYKLPQDACNTYQITFKLLEQFEDDLHVHVHLENNILFKKALIL